MEEGLSKPVETPSDTTIEEAVTEVVEQEQVSQISDMISTFGEDTPEEKKDKEPDGEPSKDEPASDEQAPEEEPDDPQDKRIKDLEAKIEELKSLLTAKPEDKPEEEASEDKYFQDRLDEVQKDLVAEYIDDEAYEAVFEKREKLNEVLKKVQNDTLQGVFRSIPKIIATLIPNHIALYNKTAEFYGKNPDLYEHRKIVGQTIDEIAAKNPGWKLDQILEVVGGKGDDMGEVRKKLGLKKQAVKAAEKENIKRPSFAKPAHVKQPGKEVQLNGVQKEISDLLESIS